MKMGGTFCKILELGGTTIKGRRVHCKRITLFDYSRAATSTNYIICPADGGVAEFQYQQPKYHIC